jgi:hypothetical protein
MPTPSAVIPARGPRVTRAIFERPLQVLSCAERIVASDAVSISIEPHGVVVQTRSERELVPWHLVHSLSLERGQR